MIAHRISSTRRLARPAVLLLLLALATACAQHYSPGEATSDPGFLLVLLHGFTILFAFIGSFFVNVEIYAFPNAGWPYDLGYVLGAAVFFGSSASAGS